MPNVGRAAIANATCNTFPNAGHATITIATFNTCPFGPGRVSRSWRRTGARLLPKRRCQERRGQRGGAGHVFSVRPRWFPSAGNAPDVPSRRRWRCARLVMVFGSARSSFNRRSRAERGRAETRHSQAFAFQGRLKVVRGALADLGRCWPRRPCGAKCRHRRRFTRTAAAGGADMAEMRRQMGAYG